jgi:hypothetical protein
MIVNYPPISAREELVFERVAAFYGSALTRDIFNEYLTAPVRQRDPIRASIRVLSKREIPQNMALTALTKQRFCQGLEESEIIWD